jgi:photosystem II stability/assembly factor-like uncharacterized protein
LNWANYFAKLKTGFLIHNGMIWRAARDRHQFGIGAEGWGGTIMKGGFLLRKGLALAAGLVGVTSSLLLVGGIQRAASLSNAGPESLLIAQASDYAPIFSDDFDRGSTLAWSLPEGWEIRQESGNWFLRAANDGSAALVNPLIYSAYRLQANVRIGSGVGSLWFRQSYAGMWYGANFKGYRLELSTSGLGLYRSLGDGQETHLAGDSVSIPAGAWQTVTISATLGHIQVWLNGSPRLDLNDSHPWYAGSIALQASGTPSPQVDFDAITFSLPPEQYYPWTQTSGPYGGFVSTIEMDPSDPQVLYAGGTGGSVFKTTNGGSSWQRLAQVARPNQEISNILIAPNSPQTVYALVKAGPLVKSKDGGLTWQRLSGISDINCAGLSTQSSLRLAAASLSGGVFSSPDGGASWTDIQYNLPPTETVAALAVAGGGEIWAGTTTFSGYGGGGLYRLPSGATAWESVNAGQAAGTDLQNIFVDPANPNILYAGFGDPWNIGPKPGEQRLFKITINDKDYTSLPISMPTPPARPRVIGKSRSDGALYVVSGGTTYRFIESSATWTEITIPQWIVDPTDLAVHPGNANVLYLPRRTTGILKSSDGGLNWFSIDQGILASTVIHLAVPNIPGSDMIYSDGYRSTNRGQSWQYYVDQGIGHPFFDELMVNPHNPNEVWTVVDQGTIFTSTNAGATWDFGPVRPVESGFRYGSIYAMAAAPSDADILYALKNGMGIMKTVDQGNSWRFLTFSEVDYSYSLAVHPQDPNILYSGYTPKPFQDWAMVRQTLDGGDTWTTTLLITGSTGVTSVAIDPQQPDTVYAGSTGEGGSLWVTHNGGGTWDALNPRFNFTNIHAFAAAPSDPQVAYAGVWGGGTFRTNDGGQTWARLPNDPTSSASAILINPQDPGQITLADRTSPRLYRVQALGGEWQTLFDPGTGYYRVMTAVLAPSQPDVVYASIFGRGGPMDGDVFRIQNGVGVTVTVNLPRLPVALAVDPANADTVYAALHGYGVYKSTSGGASWSEISGAGSGLPQTPRVGFNGLVVSPANSNVLYLFGGCDVQLDLSHSGADPAVMNTVYRSEDGGATWTNLNDGSLGANSGAVKSLALSPLDPGVLYAGTLNGVWRSPDAGANWENISAGLAYTHTAGAALSQDGKRVYAPTLGGGVYSGTIDPYSQALTWSPTSHLTATIYNVQLAIDPSDSQTLYASAYPGGVFKSTNAGQTWQEANFGMASFHIDDPNRQGYYALAIAPSNPQVLYLGLYGVGVYRSEDGAGTWRPVNGMGRELAGKGITALLVDPASEDGVIAATEDGVYRSQDGGVSWQDFSQGLLSTDIRTLARGANGALFAGSRGYEVFRRTPASTQWVQTHAFVNFGIIWPIWDNRPNYQFTSLLFHPEDPNTIILGTFPAGIFKSSDKGQSWRESNVGWTNDGVFYLTRHPQNPDLIFAGTYNGVNRSPDGGAHWLKSDNGWPAEQWTYAIVFDPLDTKTLYACSKNGENMGRGRDGFHGTVMKSTDLGQTWFPITTGLNINQEFYELIADPYRPGTLYLATQYEGVFVSRDGGALWLPWNEGLTNTLAGTNGNHVSSPMVLSADGRYLYFGSAGSGAFRRATGVINLGAYLPLISR